MRIKNCGDSIEIFEKNISLACWAKILESWNFQDMKVMFIGKFAPENWNPK